MKDTWPPSAPADFGKRLTIFEHIIAVQACSDNVTAIKRRMKDHPNDPSLQGMLDQAEEDLTAAASRSRAQIHLIRTPEPTNDHA